MVLPNSVHCKQRGVFQKVVDFLVVVVEK